ncbi:glycoside hydrolase family 3 protein [Frondihabitans cladoniiphilus]|uniref:beta-glucosidase n=1 Tax=Frondihabitans cladoniiphilus TaxID=715785 RepID=A0ABP8W605_9MICO
MSSASTFPYQDATLAIEQRVEDLLSRLELADKAGLLFHTMTSVSDPTVINTEFTLPSLTSMITERRMNHFNLLGSTPTGREFAAWQNSIQRIALTSPLGIPITFSTDPRHSFTDNPGTAILAGPFSQWPEPLGLGAIGSDELTRTFGDIARQEYVAVGIRVALHPQIDLATEPRWSRANGTFGEDAELTSRMAVAYIRGFQGDEIGSTSVSTITKHFPGGGPQKNGEDAHFPYGREQVYPGGMFEHHLKPFEAAIDAGGRQMMPYYGMPVGTPYEEVGFGFNKSVLTGLLRERFAFDGIICTDWGLITDVEMMGAPMAARAWGVEHLTREERMLKILDAGADQFGGEDCTDLLLGLVADGRVTEARLDVSVRRLLREKFALGLFENAFADEDRAEIVVGNDEFRAAGLAAQRASLTLLTNGTAPDAPMLPLTKGIRVYTEGVAPESLEGFATSAARPEDADVAILRLKAPFDFRPDGLESYFRAGSLAFPPEELDRIAALAAVVPTVVDIYLDRPAILTEMVEFVPAIVANFGAADSALLTVLFGDDEPQGSLPFDLPRSMAAVEAGREDVPFDTKDPVFRFGHGLRYRR